MRSSAIRTRAGSRARAASRSRAQPFVEQNAWSFVARTYLFDQFIADEVRRGATLVVNLAAGLDTRPYRMALPPSVRWVEVDLPETIAYKQTVLAAATPACRLEQVTLDLQDQPARRGFLARVARDATQPLVITEGLLPYLTDDEVCALGRDLAESRFERWLVDLSSPALLELMRQQMGDLVARAGAPLKFAPPDGPDFFRRCGWAPADVRSLLRTAAELNRLPEWMRPLAAQPDPPAPWTLPLPWSAVVRLAPSATVA